MLSGSATLNKVANVVSTIEKGFSTGESVRATLEVLAVSRSGEGAAQSWTQLDSRTYQSAAESVPV
jgi:hypothetical protein